MNCNEAMEQMSSYMDNMLDKDQMDEMEKHLSVCDACRSEHDALLSIAALLKDLPEMEVPPEFDVLMRQRLKEEKLKGITITRKKKWIRFTSVAAILAIGIFSISLYDTMNSGGPVLPGMGTEGDTMMMMEAPDPDLKDSADTAAEPAESAEAENSVTMKADPSNESQDPPKAMMRTTPAMDEAMEAYALILDEMYEGQSYRIVDWMQESPDIYRINIEIVKSQEEPVTYEYISYRGQDGKLWIIE